jgi:hypothetical protein
MTRWVNACMCLEPSELGELVRAVLPRTHVGYGMLWLLGAAFDGARECPDA